MRGSVAYLYSIVRGEIAERRMLLLEVVIVGLFVVDIALLLLGR